MDTSKQADCSGYSFLMAVHSGASADHLRQSLESMLNQTAKPQQIVIVKDGALTAALDAVLDDYAGRSGLMTVVPVARSGGLGRALKIGLPYCTQSLVARMDADDICMPQRCEKQLRCFADDPAMTIVGTCVSEFSGSPDNITAARNVPETHGQILRWARRRSPFNHPAIMFKKEDVLQAGGYSDWEKCQDYELFIRLLARGCRGYNIQEPLLLMRADGMYEKRKSLKSYKFFVASRKAAYRAGIAKWFDFLLCVAVQTVLFILPAATVKKMYHAMLRDDGRQIAGG